MSVYAIVDGNAEKKESPAVKTGKTFFPKQPSGAVFLCSKCTIKGDLNDQQL